MPYALIQMRNLFFSACTCIHSQAHTHDYTINIITSQSFNHNYIAIFIYYYNIIHRCICYVCSLMNPLYTIYIFWCSGASARTTCSHLFRLVSIHSFDFTIKHNGWWLMKPDFFPGWYTMFTSHDPTIHISSTSPSTLLKRARVRLCICVKSLDFFFHRYFVLLYITSLVALY